MRKGARVRSLFAIIVILSSTLFTINYSHAQDGCDASLRFAANHYNQEGNHYMADNDILGAIASYTCALELRTAFAGAYYNRAIARWQHGEHDAAMTDFMQAIELAPRFPENYWGLGNVYFSIGDYEEALNTYQDYMELIGDHAHPYIVERIELLEAYLSGAYP